MDRQLSGQPITSWEKTDSPDASAWMMDARHCGFLPRNCLKIVTSHANTGSRLLANLSKQTRFSCTHRRYTWILGQNLPSGNLAGSNVAGSYIMI